MWDAPGVDSGLGAEGVTLSNGVPTSCMGSAARPVGAGEVGGADGRGVGLRMDLGSWEVEPDFDAAAGTEESPAAV